MKRTIMAGVAVVLAILTPAADDSAQAIPLDDDDIYCWLVDDGNGKEHVECERVGDLRAECDLMGGGSEECDDVAENKRDGFNLRGNDTSTRSPKRRLQHQNTLRQVVPRPNRRLGVRRATRRSVR